MFLKITAFKNDLLLLVRASRLTDKRTCAIKKIWPNFHACRGVETYNPLRNVKWDASKLMEDIRSNPDIKVPTLYKLKSYVINEIFGGHGKSYALPPSYMKGLLSGCRSLIGVDGTHLKGNYGDSGRTDWTIISDRQKGVDLALKDVWPKAGRQYCCRHLSRNFKKAFPRQ
ncbi:Non-hemolytic phospholipase C [Bienertia sinuspersici]